MKVSFYRSSLVITQTNHELESLSNLDLNVFHLVASKILIKIQLVEHIPLGITELPENLHDWVLSTPYHLEGGEVDLKIKAGSQDPVVSVELPHSASLEASDHFTGYRLNSMTNA